MKKRIISLMICAALVAEVLSGCSKSKDTTNGKDGIKSSSEHSGASSGENAEGNFDAEVVEVEVPALARDQQLVMAAVNQAAKAQACAMLKTEELCRILEKKAEENPDGILDMSSGWDDFELGELLESVIEAWRITDAAADRTEEMADVLAQAEEDPKYEANTTLLVKEDAEGNLYAAKKPESRTGWKVLFNSIILQTERRFLLLVTKKHRI